MSILDNFKSFVSMFFAGMADDQARRGDHRGTKWRAEVAMLWAHHPYAKFFAHAVSVKAEVLGDNPIRAQRHVEAALNLLEENAEIREFEDVKLMEADLIGMRNQ